MQSFETPNPVDLRLEVHRGRVTIIAGPVTTTTVELRAIHGDAETEGQIARADVSQVGDRINVILPREHGLFSWGIGGGVEAIVRVPTGSRAAIQTGSASVETNGPMGDVKVRTGSGAISVADAGDVHIGVGSGAVEVAKASGTCSVKTGSGRIELGQVGGDARVTTGSGAVIVGKVAGTLVVVTASGATEVGETVSDTELSTASGTIRVARAASGRVNARTVSGRISIAVAGGTAAWLDVHTVSGRVESDLNSTEAPADDAPRVELHLHTVSGAVRLKRAEAVSAY